LNNKKKHLTEKIFVFSVLFHKYYWIEKQKK